MSGLLHDLRYAVRQLRRGPAFTAVAVVTLALGIGANTAIFSVVYGVLLRPLPFRDPARLALVFCNQLAKGMNDSGTAPPDFRTLREQNRSFDKLSAYYSTSASLTDAQPVGQINGWVVSSEFFATLGIKPVLGRTFLPSEEHWGSHRVVVISEDFWRTHLGSNPDLSRTTLRLNGEQYAVVGVVPGVQLFSQQNQFWMPMAWAPGDVVNSHNSYFLEMVGRLKAGVTRQQASADLNSIMTGIAAQFPENKGIGTDLKPLKDSIVGDVRPALLVLLGAVAFLLLIACVNLANLSLARGTARQKETVLRVALGASRARLIRQFIAESLLLSAAGGVAAILVASATLRLLPLAAKDLPRIHEIHIDTWAIAFTIGVSVLTGILVGLAPAFQFSIISLNDALKEGGRASAVGQRSRQMRNALVISEVSLSLALLTGAALMVQSFHRLTHVDAGFEPTHVLTFEVDLPQSIQEGVDPWANGAPPVQIGFFDQLLARISTLPGVEAVGTTSRLPLQGETWDKRITFAGRPTPTSIDQVPDIQYRSVYGNYFRALGIKLLSGRVFTNEDNANSPFVVVINKAAAKHFWPDQNPIGRVALMAPPPSLLTPELLKGMPKNYRFPWSTVVGIVDDVHYGALSADAQPVVYAPMSQGDTLLWNFVTIRTQGDPSKIISSVRTVLSQTNRDLPMANIATMEQVWSDSVSQPRLETVLFGLFGCLGLVLAAVGVYGVIAYSTNLRTQEIGIRMAIGAQRADVLTMVLRQGAKLAAIGVAIGLALSLVVTRFLANLLYGIKPTDPFTFTGVAVVLICIALIASYLPARRAANVEPMEALRYE